MDERKLVKTPTTPIISPSETFTSSHFPQPRLPTSTPRRPSTATCFSTSSLYELSVNCNDLGETTDCYSEEDAFYNGYGDDNEDESDDTDTECHADILSRAIRNSKSILTGGGIKTELIGKNWDLESGTKSPTYFKDLKSEYFSLPRENTPIFKRLVNKNSVKPQLKSFRRVTNELQQEADALQNEIDHEKLILLNLKEKDRLWSGGFSQKYSKNESESSSFKKFDIIKRANETWNLKKHSHSLKEKARQQSLQLETENSKTLQPNKLIRKRSNEDMPTDFKRRAVSSSPIGTPFLKRVNLELMSNASDDLEKMRI